MLVLELVVVVMVVMLTGDIGPIVDPKQRLSRWAICHSQLHTPAPRLQSLDQASKVGSAMDLIIQQIGAVRGAANESDNRRSKNAIVIKATEFVMFPQY